MRKEELLSKPKESCRALVKENFFRIPKSLENVLGNF